MLKIRPIESKELQSELCSLCGVEYSLAALAYGAYEVEAAESPCEIKDFIGICQFQYKAGRAHVLALANRIGVNDEEALFIMGRSALNYIDLHGTHMAVMENVTEANEKLVRMVGFKPSENGEYVMDLTGFFDKHHH